MKKRVYSREVRTTAMFKCIITFRNGMHKIVRMAIDKVAQMCAAMKMLKESPWLTDRYIDFFEEIGVDADSVASCEFKNERTGQILLSI